jgi:hypothetical protein
METKLPREIQVIDLWPASIRFVLPRRDLGKGKFIGWLLLVVGIVAMSTAVYWGLATWAGVPWVLPRFLRAPAFFLSLATLGGLIPLWWGMAALFGHREIEIRGDSIRTFERVGPLWRSKRWKLAKISKFDCVDPSADNDGQVPGFLERFYALLVRLNGGGQGMLAWGYSPELLRPLGEALTERGNVVLQRSGQPTTIGSAGAKVPDNEDLEDEDLDEEDLEDEDETEESDEAWSEAGNDAPDLEPALTQPADSKIAVDKFEGGLTIQVPPAGLWKGSSGMFFFALLWNGFMTVFTSAVICGGLNSEDKPDETALWIFPLFLALFWAVGIGLLLGALNMGRRSAMFAVAAGKLLVMQKGIFGTKQREWPVEEITGIALGASGMKVNDRDVRQLQIHASSEKLGLLTGRDETELEWLACELRSAWRTAKSSGQPHAPQVKPRETEGP